MNDDDAAVWKALEESILGRAIAWGANALARASAHSRFVAASRELGARLADLSPRSRWASAGIATVVAVVTHIALVWSSRPPGLYWLILPGMALVFAAVALLLSIAAPSRPVSDPS
jgi:hypothetical protein